MAVPGPQVASASTPLNSTTGTHAGTPAAPVTAGSGPRWHSLRTPSALQLAHKITAIIGATMALLLIVAWLVLSTSVERMLGAQALQQGRSLTAITATAAAEALLADEHLAIEAMLANLVLDPSLRGAALYRRNGERYAEAGSAPLLPLPTLSTLADQIDSETGSKAPILRFVAPVRFHNANVGYLQLELDRGPLEHALRASLRLIGLVMLLMLALAAGAAYWLGQRIADPIDRLAVATKAWRHGEFESLIHERRDDELGELIHTLNELALNLQRKQHAATQLSRFVAPNVARQIIDGDHANTDGQQVHATVMFIDLVGFTSLSEQLPAQQVADLLNRYFRLLNRVVKLYNGTVDKYIGDGAMILFGTPHDDPEHAFHAICCARLFLDLCQQLEPLPDCAHLPRPAFRAGIHTGTMIAGNMGSDDRLQYTVVGDSVNQAARLCAAAPAQAIWISDAVWMESTVRHKLEIKAQGDLQFKGKTQTTRCFEIGHLQPAYADLLARQQAHILSSVPT